MGLVTDYIIALTNLYGLVTKKKVIEIYNMQNDEQISLAELNDVVEHHMADLEKRFAFLYGDYFVHETIYVFDEFEEQLEKRVDKPYYIPDKQVLLKYSDPSYFERSKEYRALRKYIERNFFKGNRYQADMLCDDIHLTCVMDFQLNDIFAAFDRRNIVFADREQVDEIIELVMDLANNVRLWENNGFTPIELVDKMRRDKGNVLSDWDFELSESTINNVRMAGSDVEMNKKKIGRNDPCPCGSGKKYKRCCLP